MTNEKEIYTTRDLYLASTLITLRFAWIGTDFQIEGERPRPVGYFKFEETPELLRTVQDYKRGKLAVEPKEFVTNMQMLKSDINEYYKNPRYGSFDK